MKLVGGQSVDLPEQVPRQQLSREKLDELPALEVGPRELHRIEGPPHTGEAPLEEALWTCRGLVPHL